MLRLSLLAFGLEVLAPSTQGAGPVPQRDAGTRAGVASAAPVRNASLQGTVKGPDANPLREALAFVRCGEDEPWRTTRTDAQGRFRIEPVSRGPCTVRVEAPGFASALMERVRPGAPLQVALRPGGTIKGLVRDGATGQPVRGVRVQAFAGESVPWEPKAGAVETTTDACGSYQLRGLAAGLYTIRAIAPGRRHARRRRVLIGQRADMILLPGGSGVLGTVRGGDGKPIAGAVVAAERTEGSREDFAAREPLSARSDALGHFEIGGLDPATYRLTIRHASFALRLLEGVVVEAGADTSTEVALEAAVSVIGRLVNPEERAIAGKVCVERLGGSLLSPAIANSGILSAQAGANGRFRLEGAPSGTLTLTASAPGFGGESVDLHTKPDQALVDLGDIKLQPGHVIRGHVSDRAGTPIAGALVSGSARSAALRAYLGQAKCASAADGSFVLAGLAPGTYTLRVSAHGYPTALVAEVEPDGPAVGVELDSGGAITGVVNNESSQPVTAYEIEADSKATTGFGGHDSVAREDGRFLIEGLAAGRYDLVVMATDHPRVVVSSIEVSPGATADVGTVRLGAGGAVRGVVVDTTGAGVAGAVVTVLTAPNVPPTGFEPQATTDATGAFEARGVTEGTVLIKARHPRYAEGQTSGVEVIAARGPAEVRLVLSQGARLDGRVVRRDGEGVAGAAVQILGSIMGGPQGPSRELLVRPDGAFVADHLTPGVTVVRAVREPQAGENTGLVKVVTLRDGETTTVEFRLADVGLSGKVTRGGGAFPGLRVEFRGGGSDAEASSRALTLTGVDGMYQTVLGAPGRYRVRGETTDGKTAFALGSIDVPDAETWSVDFGIGAVSVTGTVADQETQEPIAGARVTARSTTRATAYAATSAADGHFELELPEGAYRVSATADDYGEDVAEVNVVAEGTAAPGLRLTRGLAIHGRVVDAGGRGLQGLPVTARAHDDGASIGSSVTGIDGSFGLAGLRDLPYNLLAGSAASGFGFRGHVVPGGEDVSLALRRAGRVRLTVRDPEGLPVPLAGVRVTTVAGVPVLGLLEGVTDTAGIADVPVPQESVEILAVKGDLAGRVRIPAEAGDVSAEIVLSPLRE